MALDEESKNDKSAMTFRTQQSKATSSLFPSKMIAKRERTQRTAKQIEINHMTRKILWKCGDGGCVKTF